MSGTPDQSTRPRRVDGGQLAEELRGLPQRTTRELRERWQTLIGTMPPLPVFVVIAYALISPDPLSETDDPKTG